MKSHRPRRGGSQCPPAAARLCLYPPDTPVELLLPGWPLHLVWNLPLALSKQNSEQSRHVPKAFRTPTSHNKLGTDSPEMDLSNSNGNRCVQIFLLREHATEG